MSLSDDIKDKINNALPFSIGCPVCGKEVDLSDILSDREWDRLIADILRAVVDEIER